MTAITLMTYDVDGHAHCAAHTLGSCVWCQQMSVCQSWPNVHICAAHTLGSSGQRSAVVCPSAWGAAHGRPPSQLCDIFLDPQCRSRSQTSTLAQLVGGHGAIVHQCKAKQGCVCAPVTSKRKQSKAKLGVCLSVQGVWVCFSLRLSGNWHARAVDRRGRHARTIRQKEKAKKKGAG